MKKIININLSGRLIPIEDSAYEVLRQYLDSLKRYFAKEEGGDEIVTDIEARIAELFNDKLKNGAHCITDADVEAVKLSMGTPEQFDEDAPKDQHQQQSFAGAAPAGDRPRKRFYRDPEDKVVSGVCGGLGAYFNVDPVVFRIIFTLLVLGSFGAAAIVYIVLWVSAPYAETSAEKLEMRGEKVDLNNIKNTVQEEMHNVKNQFAKAGNDIKNFSQGRGRQIGNDIERFFLGFFRGLGKVIVAITKSFFIFFAVVILFCLIVTGIALIVSSAALVPLQHLVFANGTQVVMFWGSLGLIIGIPVLALVIFLVRKATGAKQTSRFVAPTLAFLWIIGLVTAAGLASSFVRDVRRSSTTTDVFNVAQPPAGKLLVKLADKDYIYHDDDIEFGIFDDDVRITGDTTVINDIRVRLEKSNTDSFQVEVLRYAKGRTNGEAAANAENIVFQLSQQDSVLYIPRGFGLREGSRYRVQRVVVVIKVPKGKNIDVDNEVYRHFSFRSHSKYDDDYFYDRVWRDEDGRSSLEVTPGGEIREKNKTQPANKDSLETNYKYHSSFNIALPAPNTAQEPA
ncbi:phage shock protein C (PspC) family protein [Chitinophaga jiangningensis]|uniref:Phage shock protein C (PspC) family protein n=1 Tax=Chitinophaga jiangningensis TaxID=1419482 RepID=A0A1M7ELQ8_9BACT|nr:PspC domain-containing protein [Chitinophaga jiangningensis]SHL92731.1 phage shock protein C (PspC) family protein [Chitinophaga jiangningensis]